MKLVFLDAGTLFGVSNLDILAQFGECRFHHHSQPSEIVGRLSNAAIAITNKVVIGRKEMEALPDLKLICVAATGMNNIDLEAAKELNIAVKNVSGYSTHSVAQITWGMIFHLLNHTTYYDQYVKSGEYVKNEFFTHVAKPFWQVARKRIGIVGMGNIGKRVAEIATAFGMEVVYCSLSGKNSEQPYKLLSFDELLKTSDIVSIHSPLNDNTKGLFTYEKLSLMKSNAILINVGRGGIVDEYALAKALDENKIAAAGIDVFEKEPMTATNPLLSISNPEKVVMLPHIAWASVEARERLVELIKDNIEDFLAN